MNIKVRVKEVDHKMLRYVTFHNFTLIMIIISLISINCNRTILCENEIVVKTTLINKSSDTVSTVVCFNENPTSYDKQYKFEQKIPSDSFSTITLSFTIVDDTYEDNPETYLAISCIDSVSIKELQYYVITDYSDTSIVNISYTDFLEKTNNNYKYDNNYYCENDDGSFGKIIIPGCDNDIVISDTFMIEMKE